MCTTGGYYVVDIMVSFFFIMGNYGQLLWARMGDWTDGACVLFVTGYVCESIHAGHRWFV
jgi:hypothetical protein